MKSSQAVHPHYAARQPVPQPKPRRRVVQPPVEPEMREIMIAEAAYYIAERRGFEPGAEMEDWLEAETAIDQLLAALVAEGDDEDEEDGARSPDPGDRS
ncbi:MAG TPA: DUF2934 domain-containing protein [Burkholderiales bacterium]|nr:DUF2934 domain-containing protein [Burkholderiales bacterium]